MRPFIRGFIVGFILKKQIINIFEKVLENCILVKEFIQNNNNNNKKNSNNNNSTSTTITLAVKIVNKKIFNETFNGLIPPLWDYYPKKNVILIDLPESIFNYITDSHSLSDLMSSKNYNGEYIVTVDLQLLKTFSDLYLYINYEYNNTKYINIYSEYSTINNTDFTEYKDIPKILSVSLKYSKNRTEYLTLYFKKFLRNEYITPELLLLNYPTIKSNLEESKIYILSDNLKEYSYTEQIEFN